jgi:hypothetical protein
MPGSEEVQPSITKVPYHLVEDDAWDKLAFRMSNDYHHRYDGAFVHL